PEVVQHVFGHIIFEGLTMMVDGCGGEREGDIGRSGIGEALYVSFDAQHIRVAVTVGISMRAGAEAEVGEGAPVLQVVAAHKF
ncbi:MAG: hypothetical protein CUN52_15880, partial [Phototrophicales bacterium]